MAGVQVEDYEHLWAGYADMEEMAETCLLDKHPPKEWTVTPGERAAIDLLARYAFWAGTGHHTTQGMGLTRPD